MIMKLFLKRSLLLICTAVRQWCNSYDITCHAAGQGWIPATSALRHRVVGSKWNQK